MPWSRYAWSARANAMRNNRCRFLRSIRGTSTAWSLRPRGMPGGSDSEFPERRTCRFRIRKPSSRNFSPRFRIGHGPLPCMSGPSGSNSKGSSAGRIPDLPKERPKGFRHRTKNRNSPRAFRLRETFRTNAFPRGRRFVRGTVREGSGARIAIRRFPTWP